MVVVHKDRFPGIAEQWRKINQKDDSAFVGKYTDVSQYHPVIFHDGTFLQGSKDALKKANSGDVVGPFRNNNAEYLLRVTKKGKTCDSVQVSHILITWLDGNRAPVEITRTKVQAKKKADSLCDLISRGKVLLENVVVQETDDPGSKAGNLGNYGWFTRESGFVEVFKSAGFDNPVGATVVIESEFGFHIVQVEKKTREYDAYYAWQIVKIIDTCYREDGVTALVYLGGFPGGDDSLGKYITRGRMKYPSIATPRIEKQIVWVFWDVLPDGSVSNVRVGEGYGLSDEEKSDIQRLFGNLPAFVPSRTCAGPIGQVEMWFFDF